MDFRDRFDSDDTELDHGDKLFKHVEMKTVGEKLQATYEMVTIDSLH